MYKKVVTINDIREASDLWIEKYERKLLSGKTFYIAPESVLNDIPFHYLDDKFMSPQEEENDLTVENFLIQNNYYLKLKDEMEEKGWDVAYPLRITIIDKNNYWVISTVDGNIKPNFFVTDGNHRCNMLRTMNVKVIPCKFVYLKEDKHKLKNKLK
jgi:hypothetical protein